MAIRHEHARQVQGGGRSAGDVRETGALFRSLQRDPFDTVAEIVDDPALKDVDAERKARLAELIQAYTESVSEGGRRHRTRLR